MSNFGQLGAGGKYPAEICPHGRLARSLTACGMLFGQTRRVVRERSL